ncbi:glycosyltransferase family 4 protein [Vibrio sp. B172a]|uniref:glycosyltransferase family 4 protein n=1 Tax=Vibrio sp. B172a TaxID=2835790 RepID=UPI002555F3D2|nr:glycosyltransferase family 4 protein [Vibrio sp. B172a]MDK9782462.1 glycosyltransferase family 4 protein [Vibrio sp. B172a]
MRLALIIDDYLPQSTRVAAKMYHELARYLVENGHDVTVITPSEGQKESLVQSSLNGVNIWRFSSGAIKDTPKIKRAINESLLSKRAWSAISSCVKESTFDGVVYYSPSIFFGGLVAKIKTRCHCPSYLVLRDIFPQWVIDAGMIKKGSLIETYFRYFEKRSYQQANMIGLMSEKNRDMFNEMTADAYSTEILRNWAELTPYVKADDKTGGFRKQLGLEDKIVFFYGGNIGHAQDMANLMRLTKEMSLYKDAHFLYVGSGDEVDLINELAQEWQLENFTYLPSVNQDEFKALLAEVDVGLFSLSSQHTAHNFPGKLLGYMVQSIPILGSVNSGNDLMDIVNDAKAGLISVNGDDDKLLRNAIALYESRNLRRDIGSAAYLLLENDFSVQSAAESIVAALRLNS